MARNGGWESLTHCLTPSVRKVRKIICACTRLTSDAAEKQRGARGTECIEELARLRGCWWRRQKGRLCLHILHKRLHKCQPSECVWASAKEKKNDKLIIKKRHRGSEAKAAHSLVRAT